MMYAQAEVNMTSRQDSREAWSEPMDQLHRCGVLHRFLYGYSHQHQGASPLFMVPEARPRSGSLGSTGSSVRSERFSPSYEPSYESYDEPSRQSSPLSDLPPSPSPPLVGGSIGHSKLMGILQGSIVSPYIADESSSLKRRCYDDEAPMDLSCKRARRKFVEPSPREEWSGSILKSILSGGGASRGADRCLGGTVCHNARVALAKKNLLPVTARISDWLTRTVLFAKDISQFMRLPSHDRLTLLANAWPRLLLLQMAQANFQFAVTPVAANDDPADGGAPTDGDSPTAKFVDDIQGFIAKCQSLNFDHLEYEYVRLATLFHTGYAGVEQASCVERFNAYVRRVLQEHVERSQPTDKLRYSTILLAMPMLFGINCRMLEALFCRHISARNDGIVGLLHEMLDDDSTV